MSFGDVLSNYRQLRARLVSHFGDRAFPEIELDVPRRDDDEISFLKLVFWGYALTQETGRVSLKFLSKLPPMTGKPTLPHVTDLRTWGAHNLSLTKESDVNKRRKAWAWFKGCCGRTVPTEPEHWKCAFRQLCAELTEFLANAVIASEAFDDPEDGERLKEQLNVRLDKNWDAYRFDIFVTKSAENLGYPEVDAVEFRRRNLDAWRKVVEISQDTQIDSLLTKRIESDLLAVMNNALPMTAANMLEYIELDNPQEVATLLLTLRARRNLPRAGIGDLLIAISAELKLNAKQPTDN